MLSFESIILYAVTYVRLPGKVDSLVDPSRPDILVLDVAKILSQFCGHAILR